MSEIVKSEYNALDEQGNYKTHYFKTSADQVVGLGRLKNTEYQVNDVAYSDTNNKVALKCITAGTTSNTELDISAKAVGDTVTDGSVVWQVCNRTSDVTSVNGKTGDVVVDVGVTSINDKTGAVTLKESPSDMTDYIIESYRNGKQWYKKYKSGFIEQGGETALLNTGKNEISLLTPMRDTNYVVIISQTGNTDAPGTGDGMYVSDGGHTAQPVSTTKFKTYQWSKSKFNWYVCG